MLFAYSIRRELVTMCRCRCPTGIIGKYGTGFHRCPRIGKRDQFVKPLERLLREGTIEDISRQITSGRQTVVNVPRISSPSPKTGLLHKFIICTVGTKDLNYDNILLFFNHPFCFSFLSAPTAATELVNLRLPSLHFLQTVSATTRIGCIYAKCLLPGFVPHSPCFRSG